MKKLFLCLFLLSSWSLAQQDVSKNRPNSGTNNGDDKEFASRLIAAAKAQIGVTVSYNGDYKRLKYPGGDLPIESGVCTDVVIRAFRVLGFDLQVLVHEDMKLAWSAYPKAWGMRGTDSNIDHRRVPNLVTYFKRHGETLPITAEAKDYQPGDLVTWRVGKSLPHIGIISAQKSPTGVPLVIHNIGRGTQIEDALFHFVITGHYRWLPKK